MRYGWVLAVATSLATAGTSFAQPREPLPRVVVDARASSAGLPAGAGWTPTVPVNTEVPSLALGFDAGAHLIFKRFNWGGFGVGGAYQWARGQTAPPQVEGQPALVPTVTTRITSLLPQLSVNFGHGMGFSSISAGIGRARVSSEAIGPSANSVPRLAENDAVQTFHFGGGVRWFLNDRLGAGFDVRFQKLPAVAATGAAKTTIFTAAVGVSIK
jgi:hypothetical protein